MANKDQEAKDVALNISSRVSGSSSSWARFPVFSLKLAVEIFDGTGHFDMWQGEVLDSLFQQGLDIAIEEKKPEGVEDKDWSIINRLACGTIRSCLSREQKYALKNVTSAHKLWKGLEDKFLKKSGQNKLLMKKRLFRFDNQQDTTMNEHITVSSSSSSWSRFPVSSLKLAVEIFDGTGHFGMWQGEVLDSLFQQGLDIAIEEEKPEEIEDKDWSIINRLACVTIRSCLSKEQKYALKNETSAHKLWKTLEDKFLKKSGLNKFLMKKRLFRFDYQQGTTMNEHITMFNQLLAELLNLDVKFEDEDLALMLLSSLPDEFEHLETTLLHGKENVSLDGVCSALYSHELRKQNKMKNKSTTSEKPLVVRGRQQSQTKGRRGRSKSKGRAIAKDECAFYHEKGHWKKVLNQVCSSFEESKSFEFDARLDVLVVAKVF